MTGTRTAGSAPPPEGTRQPHKRGIQSRPWWPWAKRAAYILFLTLVAFLLVMQAREVDWEEVITAIRRRPPGELASAVAFAAASYALYSCFDLLGRRYTGHGLGAVQVITVNFISYAFNLNLGALVGGVAFRYRLYSRLGLGLDVVTRVLAISMLTNWLGYILLTGVAFWWWPVELPPGWKIDSGALRILGLALFGTAVAYTLLCALARQRTWTVRGHEFTLPSLRLALLQLAMSSANWLVMACAIYMLLGQKIAFPLVLEVLLMAAIAGVIMHVPAGLGVLEAVFVALLSHRLPEHELLAALLTYRGIYYLAPLMAAALLYLVVEMRAKKARA